MALSIRDPKTNRLARELSRRNGEPMTQAIRKAFPVLQVEDIMAVTRFIDPATDRPVIDLMKPHSDLHQSVADYSVPVGKSHRVPDLEMALALKFAAMDSPHRKLNKKLLDKADFVSMVVAHGNEIEEDVLFSLGEMVESGGGKEILKLVEEARAESETQEGDAEE